MPALSGLFHRTGRPARLAVIDGGEVVVIASIGGPETGRADTGGAALVLLAHAPPPVRERFLAGPGAFSGPAGRAMLADIRRRGVAVHPVSVAAAVRDPAGGVTAAVEATGRPGGAPHALVDAVVAAAADISRRLAPRGLPGRGSAGLPSRGSPGLPGRGSAGLPGRGSAGLPGVVSRRTGG
jgi:DNA-binding IclR family transcriptional regulator